MAVTQKQIAEALGVSPARVAAMKQQGMPVDSINAAREWRSNAVGPYTKDLTPSVHRSRPVPHPLAGMNDDDLVATLNVLTALAGHDFHCFGLACAELNKLLISADDSETFDAEDILLRINPTPAALWERMGLDAWSVAMEPIWSKQRAEKEAATTKRKA